MGSVSDTRYKQRAVIEFLVAEKESVENIHKWLCAVYGSYVVNRSTIGHWVQRVKASGSGEMELHDRPRSGRPATATRPDILVDVIARGETVNLDVYIKTLQKLKQRYWGCGLNRNPGDMLLQHDNARPNTSLRTQEAIAKFGWTVLPHRPYNHDLGLSDFHLFGPLKDTLCGTSFDDDEHESCTEAMDT
jgi:transposase